MTPNAVLSFIALLSLAAPAVAQAKPPAEGPKDGLRVGAKLPFLVVRFYTGTHRNHEGCPSVMIANANSRGLVIWSRAADEPSLRLARSADAQLVDGDKVHGYLVVFDEATDGLADKLTK